MLAFARSSGEVLLFCALDLEVLSSPLLAPRTSVPFTAVLFTTVLFTTVLFSMLLFATGFAGSLLTLASSRGDFAAAVFAAAAGFA